MSDEHTPCPGDSGIPCDCDDAAFEWTGTLDYTGADDRLPLTLEVRTGEKRALMVTLPDDVTPDNLRFLAGRVGRKSPLAKWLRSVADAVETNKAIRDA